MLTLTFHSDPGHGWLQVDRRMMETYGVKPSGFSYVDGNAVFLEEDCDAALFIDVLKERGIEYNIRHVDHGSDCFIRRLQNWG